MEYNRNPFVSKPIERIFEDLDGCTYEVFEDEPHLHPTIDFTVVLPPLFYDGTFVPGLFYSRGVDCLLNSIPRLSTLFHSVAYSLSPSYPWSVAADAYFTCYDNATRETWFRLKHPQRGSKVMIPVQDADYTNENVFRPLPGMRKDIDILCISRLSAEKNLPMIAQALKILRSRYPKQPVRMTLITGNKSGYGRDALCDHAWQELQALNRILVRPEDYIDFVNHADHWSKIAEYYSRAKLFVLGSLIEGKNRCINEALSCDVPVVCFRELNQYARLGAPLLPDGGGLYAGFNAESLAEAMHTALVNAEFFTPRSSYLRENGRSWFLNRCIDAIDRYETVLPGFLRGRHHENRWLDTAVRHNYQINLHEFTYSNSRKIAQATGIAGVRALVDFFDQSVGGRQ